MTHSEGKKKKQFIAGDNFERARMMIDGRIVVEAC